MSLKGKLVYLRPVDQKDLERTFHWRNDPEMVKLVKGYRFPVSKTNEEQWLNKVMNDRGNESIYYAIDCLENNEHIGLINLHLIDWISRVANLGIIIGDTIDHKKGYGEEACRLLIEDAFDNFNLNKISLEVADYNIKAISLYKKLNFKIEGTLKEHYFIDKKLHDVFIMSLFAKDYAK